MTLRAFLSGLFLISILGLDGLAQAAETLIVPHGTRILARLETTLSSKSNRQGDRFTAKVTEPVLVRGIEAIPAGSTIEGRVARVEEAGRVQGRAEISLAYERLVFPNGISETIVGSQADLDDKEKVDHREGTIKGESSRKRDAAEIGVGAAVGAGIGGISGGGKGAAIGAGIGGLIGLVDSMRRKGKPIEIPAGTLMVIRLERPLQVLASREENN